MEVYRGLEQFRHDGRPVFLALGMFDGVHRGHQAILGRTREAARPGGRSVALTFDPHPRRVIAPTSGPILLTTVEERLALVAALGLDAVVVVPFDAGVRDLAPTAWIARLTDTVRPSAVFASAGHTFGRDRLGGVALLTAEGRRWGFQVVVVPPVRVREVTVSSSLIRSLVQTGDVEGAARLLGRWYAVRGRVVEGAGRGRALGVPTANLAVPPDKVLPALGIYAAWARLGADRHAAAVSVGTRPTFGPGEVLVEAHLLDTEQDLYGREIELMFAVRLRPEIAFETVEGLIRQMAEDIARTRDILRQDPRASGSARGPGTVA